MNSKIINRKFVSILLSVSFITVMCSPGYIAGVAYAGETPNYNTETLDIAEVMVIEPDEMIEEPPVEEIIEEETEPLSTEDMIRLSCENYGIPSGVALAISRLETGHWTSDAYIYGNNVGGLSVSEVPMTFATLKEGVEAFVSNLAENYYYIGLDTPEAIGSKYCPVNPGWADMVWTLMYQHGYA